MRVDQATATVRSSCSNDPTAPQASFDQHLLAARDNPSVRDSRGANDNVNVVTVKRGDTLSDIARRSGVSMKGLYHANPQFDPHRQDGIPHFDRSRHGGWDPDYIRPGDRIKLPSHPARRPHSPSDHPQRLHPQVGSHGRSNSGAPNVDTPKLPHPPGSQNSVSTPNGPNANATPNVPATPNAPGVPNASASGPNAQNVPNTSNPPSSSVPPTGSPQHGLTPVIPIVPHYQVLKGGVGIEAAGRGSTKPTLSGEPYVKGSLALGPNWNINGKIKYTPRGKLTFGADDKAAGDADAPRQPKPSLRERVKAALPEKITVDTGLVYNKQVEGGASLEIKFDKGIKHSLFTYLSQKDPANVLVDSAQIKLGKLDPMKVGGAFVNGTHDSLVQSTADAKASGGRWSPLRQQLWKALNGGEITIAGERAYVNPHGAMSGFVNYAGKTTLKDIAEGLEHPAAAPRLTRFTGFATGTAVSIVGAGLTDKLIGQNIHNEELRRAVDGFGGAMSGLVADPLAQKTLPAVASKVAPTLSRLAAPVVSKAAPLLDEAAPVLSKVGEVASKIPLGATGRVLSKAARIGGPAGALVAGIPDGIDAFKAFQKGDTTDGWKAVGRGAVRVAGTAVGAVVGQALIPIPGVGAAVGAVAGGFVGDLVAKLF